MKQCYGKPLTDTSMEHSCSLVVQDHRLVMISAIDDFKNCAAGSIGDFLANAGRTMTFLSTLSGHKWLKATQLRTNSISLGYELSHPPIKPGYTLKRYFAVFSDRYHRMELAFIILKEAQAMTNNNVVCQFLWHPDSWYVLEE